MKLALTDRFLRSIKTPAKGRETYADTVRRGLVLRVTEKGAKTWSIGPRVNGRRRRFTIGNWPEISLADARERAARLLVEVRDGRDPVEEARKARAAAKAPQAITLEEALRLYAKAVLSSRRTGRVVERDLRRDLAELLSLPVAAISKAQLAHIVDAKAAKAPISANRLQAALRPFWRWLTARGHAPTNVASDIEKPSREQARDRVLSDDELSSIWQATEHLGDLWGPFVRLLFLTAQRRQELAAMEWSEIGLEASVWRLPASRSKTNREHVVHLSKAAVEALRQREAAREGCDLVFSTTGTTPVSGFSRMKTTLDKLSGVSGWRLHDARRTFATWAADNGIDPAVADRVLNHVGAGTLGTVQRVYQRSALLEPRRHALDAWGQHLASRATKGAPTAKVVNLTRG